MRNKKYIIIAVLLIMLVMISASPAFARYIIGGTTGVGIQADKFYFTVDLLGDTNNPSKLNATYNLYGGDEKEINFTVQNYFDDFRITGNDIDYTITYSVQVPTGSSYDTNLITLTRSNDTNILTKSVKSEDVCTLTVPQGYNNNTTVTVTIQSSKPYTKTIVLTFIYHTFESEMSYYIVDSVNSLYAELIIKSNINIPENKLIIDFSDVNSSSNVLQIDMTNTYLLDIVNGELVQDTNKVPDGELYLKTVYNTVQINSGEAITIKFFKSDITKNYSCSETLVNEVSSVYTVTIKNPKS